MKKLILAICLFFIPLFMQAQETPQNFVGAGASWNQFSTPQISGNLFFAQPITENTYSFNVADITSKTIKPFTVAISITPGIARYMATINNVRIYGLATAGVSTGDSNVGWAWSSGGIAIIPVGKKGWAVLPSVRVLKSSLSDFQAVYGIALGWGK